MKKMILLISIIGLMVVGCSDDDNPAASTGTSVTFTEGTYNMTSATFYEAADCSGTGSAETDVEDWSLTFGANGVFTDSDGDGGTYTVAGTTITVVDTDCCYDSATDDCTDATTEATCTGDGEWEEGEAHTATFADGTISFEMSNPGECNGYDDENEGAPEPADETACNTGNGHWESGCYIVVFTLSTD